MLSHFARAAALLTVATFVAIAAGGCGIKGPLTLPQKPEAGKEQPREAQPKRSP